MFGGSAAVAPSGDHGDHPAAQRDHAADRKTLDAGQAPRCSGLGMGQEVGTTACSYAARSQSQPADDPQGRGFDQMRLSLRLRFWL